MQDIAVLVGALSFVIILTSLGKIHRQLAEFLVQMEGLSGREKIASQNFSERSLRIESKVDTLLMRVPIPKDRKEGEIKWEG